MKKKLFVQACAQCFLKEKMLKMRKWPGNGKLYDVLFLNCGHLKCISDVQYVYICTISVQRKQNDSKMMMFILRGLFGLKSYIVLSDFLIHKFLNMLNTA